MINNENDFIFDEEYDYYYYGSLYYRTLQILKRMKIIMKKLLRIMKKMEKKYRG